mgnify:CR=1 FL=1
MASGMLFWRSWGDGLAGKLESRWVLAIAASLVAGLLGAGIWEVSSLLFPEVFFGPEAMDYSDGLQHFSERHDSRQWGVSGVFAVAGFCVVILATRREHPGS